MAPNESEILTNYLVQPSSLTSIITFEQFKALFPRPLQSSPQVRSFFRDLQAQRNVVLDTIAENIELEAKRGIVMRREVLKAQRDAEKDEVDGEIEMERALFGARSGVKDAKHDLNTIIPELDGANGALEVEIEKLQEEESALLEAVQQTVGGLSDLRYGKFANTKIKDEVIDGLETVLEACKSLS